MVILFSQKLCLLSLKFAFLNKKLLHCHPGNLPEFKGSTTIYYSILSNIEKKFDDKIRALTLIQFLKSKKNTISKKLKMSIFHII